VKAGNLPEFLVETQDQAVGPLRATPTIAASAKLRFVPFCFENFVVFRGTDLNRAQTPILPRRAEDGPPGRRRHGPAA
jgi:hypothetical protein